MPKVVRLNCRLMNNSVNRNHRCYNNLNYENIDFEGLKEMFHVKDENSSEPNITFRNGGPKIDEAKNEDYPHLDIPTIEGSKENPDISAADGCNAEPIVPENPFKTILDGINNLSSEVNKISEQLGELLSDTTNDKDSSSEESEGIHLCIHCGEPMIRVKRPKIYPASDLDYGSRLLHYNKRMEYTCEKCGFYQIIIQDIYYVNEEYEGV